MSSCEDRTVPWYSSTQFCQLLISAGVPCRKLMYNHSSHVDFVVDYTLKAPPDPTGGQEVASPTEELSPDEGPLSGLRGLLDD